MQRTSAYLQVEFPGETPYYIDEVKEFAYSSDVMAVGDTCTFTVVLDPKGEALQKLRLGADLRLRLKNNAVNGGNWTLKHRGRIVQREASLKEGTVQVTSADLGWHLTNCSAPLWRRLRNIRLNELLDPQAKTNFLDPTFALQGLRTGLDANALQRRARQGKSVIGAQPYQLYDPVQAVQVEPGESFYDVITRYVQRDNLLINVTMDGYLQAWNPDYDREPAYRFYCNSLESNISDAKRFDDASTRYTDTVCVGEIINWGAQYNNDNPNALKRRGFYKAKEDEKTGLPAPLPFTNRLTFGDGEMYTSAMAQRQAEWRWKRGMFDSHYLQIEVLDHYQLGLWLESDEMAFVDIPQLEAVGLYYVQSVHCTGTEDRGDVTTVTLRWPHLLSASWGEWRNPPKQKSKEAQAALRRGKGGGQ